MSERDSIDEVRQFVHVNARHDGPRHDTCLACSRMRRNEVTGMWHEPDPWDACLDVDPFTGQPDDWKDER